jgi:nucleoside-diphosphate-sugar epimerase
MTPPLSKRKSALGPMDTYPISKMCFELISRDLARRFGVDIYYLCMGKVIEPHEHEDNFSQSYVSDMQKWKRRSRSYTDARN